LRHGLAKAVQLCIQVDDHVIGRCGEARALQLTQVLAEVDQRRIFLAAVRAWRAEQQAAGAPTKESAQTTTTAESAEESNDSFWDKVKKWDQENVEKSKQTTKEGPSVDDHVKKAFGQ